MFALCVIILNCREIFVLGFHLFLISQSRLNRSEVNTHVFLSTENGRRQVNIGNIFRLYSIQNI